MQVNGIYTDSVGYLRGSALYDNGARMYGFVVTFCMIGITAGCFVANAPGQWMGISCNCTGINVVC